MNASFIGAGILTLVGAVLLRPVWPRRRPIAVALVGLVLAIVGLCGSVLSTAGQFAGPAAYRGLGVGGMERVADYPGTVWTVLIGSVAIAWVFGLVGQRPLPTAERAA